MKSIQISARLTSHLATSLLCCLVVACSASSSETTLSSSSDITGAAAVVGKLGNPIDVVVQPNLLAPPTVQVTYEDRANHFGGASTIHMYIDTSGHAVSSGALLSGSSTVTLTGSGTTYTGIYEVAWIDRKTDEMVLDSVALAFSDDAGHRWDSNDSKNYIFAESADFPVVNYGSNEITTAWNNHASLFVSGIPTNGATPTVTVSYFDDVDAFGGASTVVAYLASALVLPGRDVTLTNVGQSQYTVTLPITWSDESTAEDVIASFSVAFANAAKTHWDSNDSKNYSFALGSGAQTCDVTAYGAVGDGKTDDTAAIQGAIDDCATRGVSAVSIPSPGVFLSGMITLKSNISLSIASGATLKGSMKDSDYPTVVPDPANSQVSINCQKALVYADAATNVTITGGGTIDGSGENPNWINLSTTSPDYLERNRPIAVYMAQSSNVTIENVTVLNSAMWAVVNLENNGVHVDNVTVDSNYPGSRTRDGIDTIDSQNVLIENCTIASEDDALCMKSGLPAGAPHAGVANVVVKNSTITKSQVANGLKFGTATTGPFDNIEFDDIKVSGVKQAAMAVESVDGGAITNVRFKGITVTDTGALAYVILGARGPSVGSINGVAFTDITATNLTQEWGTAISGSIIKGATYMPENISFTNVSLTAKGGLSSIPSAPAEYAYDTGEYPDPQTWGNLPAFGYYVRHASNVQFSACTSAVSPGDARPAITVTSDVTGSGF